MDFITTYIENYIFNVTEQFLNVDVWRENRVGDEVRSNATFLRLSTILSEDNSTRHALVNDFL